MNNDRINTVNDFEPSFANKPQVKLPPPASVPSNDSTSVPSQLQDQEHDEIISPKSSRTLPLLSSSPPSDLSTPLAKSFSNPLPVKLDQSSIQSKRERLESLQKECNQLISALELNESSDIDYSEAIVRKHIKSLKKYNDLKDVALSLVSMIATQKNVKVSDILEEMEISDGDDDIEGKHSRKA